jgi:hypothetical protein
MTEIQVKKKRSWRSKIKWVLLFTIPILLGGLIKAQRVVKKRLVAELNTQLAVKVQLQSVDISGLSDFPDIGVRFNDLEVDQSFPAFQGKLLKAKNITVVVNAWDLIRGRNTIKKIEINDGELKLFEGPTKNNYSIFNTDSTSTNGEDENNFQIDLKKIILKNVRLIYENTPDKQSLNCLAEKLKAKVSYDENRLILALKGSTVFDHLEIEEVEYLLGKKIQMDVDLEVNQKLESYFVNKGVIILDGLPLKVSGRAIMQGDYPNLDVEFESNNAEIKGLIALLPKGMAYPIQDWNSNGSLTIKGTAKGIISPTIFPEVDVVFDISKGILVNEKLNIQMGKLVLEGSLTNHNKPSIDELELKVKIKEFSTKKSSINGTLHVPGLGVPDTKLAVKGHLYLEDLNALFPEIDIQHGKLQMNVESSLKWDDHKQNFNYQSSSFFGDIELSSLNAKSKNFRLTDIAAAGRFKGRNWNSAKISGKIQSSKFDFSGHISEWASGVFGGSSKRAIIKGDLDIEAIDLNEFLQSNLANISTAEASDAVAKAYKGEKMLDIGWDADLHVGLDAFKYDEMDFKSVSARIQLRESIIHIPSLHFKSMDGEGTVKTTFTQEQDRVIWNGNMYFKNVLIDEFFTQFNNFNQEEITNQNLSGRLTSELDFFMQFDHLWEPITKDMVILAKINLKDGALKDYKPLESLSNFVEVEDLKDVRFSELKNVIRIEEEMIFIPTMSIKNSALNLEISGTHSFENYMDYKLKLSLTELLAKKSGWIKKRKQKQLESEAGGKMSAFILVSGTPDKLDIRFDKKAVKAKIKEEVKKEGKRFFEDIKKEIRGERIQSTKEEPTLWDE